MSLLNNKYLFVHINKSGGGIITKNMRQNGTVTITDYHRSLEKMISLIHPEIDKTKLYIFTIVRNPWDRMLSMYKFYHKNNYNAPEFFSGDSKIDDDFNNWIKYIYSDKFDKTRIHSDVNIFKYCFCNQLNWVTNNDGKIMKVDKILRFESLSNELESFLRDTLQCTKITLDKVHQTKHNHYSTYYNEITKKLVEQHYQKDIEYFGYCF